MINEIENALNGIITNYGNNAVQKIIDNRKKWDHDYYISFNKMLEEVKTVEKFNVDVLNEDTIVKSQSVLGSNNPRFFSNPGRYCRFIEGKIITSVDLEMVNMDLCQTKCLKTSLKFSDDEIEVTSYNY